MANALREFLPQTESIDILVGYFYFSGFQEVYRDIADKKMRILVGMDIDQKLIATLVRKQQHELYSVRSSHIDSSMIEEEDKYFRSLEAIFNDTDWFEKTLFPICNSFDRPAVFFLKTMRLVWPAGLGSVTKNFQN